MDKENTNWLHDLFIKEAKAAKDYHNNNGAGGGVEYDGAIDIVDGNGEASAYLQEKTVDITENGTVIVEPDEGHALSKVTANVDVKSEGVDKIQRYIELNENRMAYMFYKFYGTSVDELMVGVDTSNATHFMSMFEKCTALITIPLFNIQKATSISCMFMECLSLTTVPALDVRGSINNSSAFSACEALTEIWIRNIKTNLQVGSGTSWGHLLTLESLLHLCKECRNVNASRTLTVGSANLEKLANVYVKLIDVTDEMRAEDDLIDEKSPFVQCESTDEGAMLVTDYMTTKMWQLA